MSMVGFPLLLIPLAIYNIVVFLMPGVSFADPLVKLTLMSGAEWPVTLGDIPWRWHPVVAVRGHQGRTSRREISHRSFVVSGRVRRRGCRIFALAAVRYLVLFSAGHARDGGFSLGHRIACAARNAGGAKFRGCQATSRRSHLSLRASLPSLIPRRHRQCPQPRQLPNPCCRTTRRRIGASKPRRRRLPGSLLARTATQ